MTDQENELRISVLCSSPEHPVYERLVRWSRFSELCTSSSDLSGGDILFLVSCTELIGPAIREQYSATLVLHASKLPEGRGWSPHIWQILEGRDYLTLSLLEAEDAVDSGAIWATREIPLTGSELSEEINDLLFTAEIELMDWAIDHFSTVAPSPQSGEPSYYPRRNPEQSRIDPERSIAEQFDLLRVCDPERFPAFFDYRGRRFTIRLKSHD